MLKTCGRAGTLRVRISCHPAQMAKNDGRQVTNSGHAGSLRVRIVVPCVRTSSDPTCPHCSLVCADTQGHCVSAYTSVRTSRYLACPHCSPMYADTQKYCVSAHLYMRTHNDTACPHYCDGQYNHTKWLRADNNAIDRIYASSI